jgi:hypothetical protein
MSRLVSRILLSILMFPLAAMLYVVAFVVYEQATRKNYYSERIDMFLVAGLVTWLFVGVYWCLLWRSAAKSNLNQIGSSLLAAVIALVLGGAAGVLIGAAIGNGRGGQSFGSFTGSVLTILFWLAATVIMWRETAAERAAKIKGSLKSTVTCPTCGYNLTGLTECRCPECGSKFTIDELMALQVTAHEDIE